MPCRPCQCYANNPSFQGWFLFFFTIVWGHFFCSLRCTKFMSFLYITVKLGQQSIRINFHVRTRKSQNTNSKFTKNNSNQQNKFSKSLFFFIYLYFMYACFPYNDMQVHIISKEWHIHRPQWSWLFRPPHGISNGVRAERQDQCLLKNIPHTFDGDVWCCLLYQKPHPLLWSLLSFIITAYNGYTSEVGNETVVMTA